MCGFLAVFNGSNDDYDGAEKLLHCLDHRGPDGQGIIQGQGYWLGHRRLAIIDPIHGQQPLTNEQGSIHLICNGEIYNYKTLRRKLDNHKFETDSDNEVILHLFEELGPEMLYELEGMYALVVVGPDFWFAARDPLGIKTLYIGRKNDTYYLASEMKGLPKDIQSFVELPAGHYFTPQKGFVPYLSIRDKLSQLPATKESSAEIQGRIRNILTNVVHEQLMADIPVGCLLSGGLDSSIITALAVKEYPHKLKTFAACLEGGGQDRKAAEEVANYLRTEHYEFSFSRQDVLNAIPKVIYHLETFDPELVKSSLIQYLLCAKVRQHVKVALVGEGADEIFGGYDRFKYILGQHGPQALHSTLIDETSNLQLGVLRRVDRMSMAHGLELRPPFLDLRLVEYAHRIPIDLRLNKEGWEKWILRQAFTDLLPQHIVWRRKSPFAKGAGAYEAIIETVAAQVSERDFIKGRNIINPALRTKEEFYYYRIFREHFPSPAALGTVFRYAFGDENHISKSC